MIVQLPFTGIVGKGRSINANSGEMLNCYIEQMADGSTSLVGTPGLITQNTFLDAPVRGCYSDSVMSYWVSGKSVYKLDRFFAITKLGELSTTNGYVSFASSGIDIMLVDGRHGWIIKVVDSSLSQIIDADFPANPTDVVYTKGYFVITVKDSQVFYINETVNNAANWNGLDFAAAEGNPDKTTGLEVYHDEIVFVGYRSLEVWGFTGNVDFPLQRNTSAVIDHGCSAPHSVLRVSDAIYWLGGDDLGSGIVYRMSGYTPERISTHEIEQQIKTLPIIEDAYALSYQQDGHTFYILQFPSSNYTLAFDVITGLWHRRSSLDSLTGDYNFWKVSCLCFSGDRTLAGDIQNGNIYEVSLNQYTDDGVPIVRERTSTVAKNMQLNVFYKTLIIDMESGTQINHDDPEPLIALQWSDDAGHTWSNWRSKGFGKVGKYKWRVEFNGLGMARNRVWRIRMTDPVKFVMINAVIDYEEGLS